jgi:hypothetical protein
VTEKKRGRKVRIVLYICDSCGDQVETDDGFPIGWIRYLPDPDLGAGEIDLCTECSAK